MGVGGYTTTQTNPSPMKRFGGGGTTTTIINVASSSKPSIFLLPHSSKIAEEPKAIMSPYSVRVVMLLSLKPSTINVLEHNFSYSRDGNYWKYE